MFLNKYGVARVIEIPLQKAGSNNFAVGADWTPAAGDVKIIKDGGAAANVTNLPTAIASGNGAVWSFSLTATEMQAARLIVVVSDASTKAVEDEAFVIETYGNSSGQHEFDLDTSNPTAVQIADAYLDRDMSLGSDSGTSTVRTPRQALRALRNKWSLSGTTLTHYKEDDSTSSHTSEVTTTPGVDPITAVDPAG